MGTYADGGRYVEVAVDGAMHAIPEMWIAGFCQTNRCHVADAVDWWHQMYLLDPRAVAS